MANFREEVSNCLQFAKKLSSGVDIFVNDDFAISHKILSSTVGVTRFCYASVTGFHFEDELLQLKKTIETMKEPFLAIIGGKSLYGKKNALDFLISKCDGIVFVGGLAIEVMKNSGLSFPSCFTRNDASEETVDLLQLLCDRNVPVYLPSDFWCTKNCNGECREVFPSNSIPNGWTPIDLGPSSLKYIFQLLPKYKKILWIGPVKFSLSSHISKGAAELASMLYKLSKRGCDVIIVGDAACRVISETSGSSLSCKTLKSARVFWEFLEGRTLHGLAALDRAYAYSLDWKNVFTSPEQPLIVDIGSGNGFFIMKMAGIWEHFNFLGIEINEKLVRYCQSIDSEAPKQNKYFVSANATYVFRSIVSSYPGDLVLVTIQCPNPDFNREGNRWRMVQTTLAKTVVDLLAPNGRVFLQSDVLSVALNMKNQFQTYGNGVLVLDGDGEQWMEGNPFGVPSDWERHVIARGAPMYRVLFRKRGNMADNPDEGLLL